LLFDLIFARVEETGKALHRKARNSILKLLVDVRLNRVLISVENCRVDQFVFLSCLKLHAVLHTELFLHAVELGV